MFGSRKRKQDQEDEPLVPHGLIWHATAESETARQESPKSSKYAEIIILAPRPEAQKQQKPSPAAPIPELLRKTSTAKHPLAAAPVRPVEPIRPVLPIEPPRAMAPIIGEQLRERIKTNSLPRSVPHNLHARLRLGRTRETLMRGISWLQSSSTMSWHNAASLYSRARQGWLLVSQSVDIKKEFLRAREFAKSRAETGVARTRISAEKTRSTSARLAASAAAHALRSAANLQKSFSWSARRVPGYLATLHPRAPRVRLDFFNSFVRSRILLARRISEWEMRRGQPFDDRLWISMTLAAISAVIALVLVSVAPHYASKSLPSRLFAPASTVSADTTPDKTTRPPATDKTSTSGSAGTVSMTPAVEGRRVSPASGNLVDAAAHPKQHRSADDDYVAPDTYKYYGNAPTEARR